MRHAKLNKRNKGKGEGILTGEHLDLQQQFDIVKAKPTGISI